jgi:long-chain fatty acid transport protein
MKQNRANPASLRLAVAAGLGVLPGFAAAAGFALLEQNASGLGNAYAGTGAIAEDASTIFFNPAGMTLLPGAQVVIAGSAINLSSDFSGTGSDTIPAVNVGTGQGGDAGGWSGVPALYVSSPIGERLAVGVGFSVPFGLTTEYDDDWLGRFQGINSELMTLNVNPSIAYKLSPTVSIGAGINWQRVDAELTNASFIGGPQEGRTKLEADDDAWGWNIGALFQLGPDMRVGVSYRSAISYSLEGDVTTTNAVTGANVAAGTFSAKADAKLPDNILLSVTQMYGDKWQLLGDVQYTNWSTVDEIDVVDRGTGAVRDRLILDFDDSWRIALGVNYFLNERWTIKGGVAWDQSPVNDDNRTVRLPDNDRYWVSLGAKYKFARAAVIDIGYSHLFVQDSDINFTRPLAPSGALSAFSSTISGEYEGSVDILGVQLTWTF